MLVEIPNNRKMYNILIGKHNRQDRTEQQCYLLFTTLEPKFNGSFTLHGNGTRTRTENDGFIYYAFKCTHHTGTDNGTIAGTNGLHTHFPSPGSQSFAV